MHQLVNLLLVKFQVQNLINWSHDLYYYSAMLQQALYNVLTSTSTTTSTIATSSAPSENKNTNILYYVNKIQYICYIYALSLHLKKKVLEELHWIK